MPARQYLLAVTAIFLALAVAVVALNRAVDPFWYYRDTAIAGFNVVKASFGKYERHVKPALVQREQPASLIFGSSFAEVGFDPLHPALRAAGTSYNFGMAGAPWDMVDCNVQFALAHDAALKQIVLGIHPEGMAQEDCRAKIAKMENPEERAFLFSYDALQASINTVLGQRGDQPSHTAEGMMFYNRTRPGALGRFREVFSLAAPCHFRHAGFAEAAAAEKVPPAPDLGGLRDIIRTAREKGITVKLVVYPRHALMLERDYQCGTRQARRDAEAQIVSLVEREGGGLVQVWDFDGYHRISLEEVTGNTGQYWQDPSHFNSEFGDIMLDEMFGLKPPEFGESLTSAKLAARAAAERQARAAWLKGHPEFLRQFESLVPHDAG